jgi:hypothetical protein
MSNIQENQSKVVFDGFSEMKKPSSGVCFERTKELENTLGKALLERFKKEIEAGNLGNKK